MINRFSAWQSSPFQIVVIFTILFWLFTIGKKYYNDLKHPTTKVGIITIKGAIVDSSLYAQQYKELLEEKDIAAILLKIDSPGGLAGASQALFQEIYEQKKLHNKPIVAWIQNLGASGGYYVAAAADYIIATPTAFVGSIGVYTMYPQFNKLIEQLHVSYVAVHSGKFKTAGNPIIQTTPEQISMLQGLIDDTYETFVADVIRARPQLETSSHTIWADGKIFTGNQALSLGLIDAVGSQIVTEQVIKARAHITTDIQWVHVKRSYSWLRMLLGEEADESGNYIAAALQSAYANLFSEIPIGHV